MDAARHDRDRGSSLLRAQRDRPRGDRAGALEGHPRGQGRRGRLDADAAARPQPLRRERGHVRAEGDRGLPRRAAQPPVEGLDPRSYLNTVFYGSRPTASMQRRRPTSRSRRGGSGSARQRSSRALPRRPRSTTRSTTAHGIGPPGPGASGHARPGEDHAAPVPAGGRRARDPPPAREALYADQRAVLLQLRPSLPDCAVRREHRSLGRLRLRPSTAASSKRRGTRFSGRCPTPTTRPRRSSRSTRRTARSAR